MPRTHLANKRATVSIDGTPMAVADGSYTTSVAEDDVTNLLSGGFYEGEATIRRSTVSLTCVYDGEEPPEFDEGDLVALSISSPGTPAVVGPPAIDAIPGGPMLSGNFRIISMTWPVVNPNGTVRYSFDANNNRAFTKGQSATP